jgi:CheY-like chemotaxis protein
MRLLVAEDEPRIWKPYKIMLEARNHEVTVTENGEDCVNVYREAASKSPKPFDVVVLDYRMPKKDGIQAAKEILAINPDQRIIFASAYVKDTLAESVKELRKPIELLQKPFTADVLVDLVEDTNVYERLKDMQVDIDQLKDLNPTHDQINDLLDVLRDIQKGRSL